MRVRGVEFGRVWGASGVQGFCGEGYWYHAVQKMFGVNFRGITFAAKTTTLRRRTGNMLLTERHTPAEWWPDCIRINFLAQAVLNAVGLSGPGAQILLECGIWQQRTEPFWLSFMSVAETKEERLLELDQFVTILDYHLRYFRTMPGLQINYSCPNVGLHPEELASEVAEGLDIASRLNIPLAPKFNVLLDPEVAASIARHPHCDALVVSNTLPWGSLPGRIDWEGLFGKVSPLVHLDRNGGGLSGRPLFPLLVEWAAKARNIGIKKPMNLSGGILSREDARKAMNTGCWDKTSISLGSIFLLGGFGVKGIKQHFFKK